MGVLDVLRLLMGHEPPSPPVVFFSADAARFDESRRLDAFACVLKTRPDDLIPLLEAHCRTAQAPRA